MLGNPRWRSLARDAVLVAVVGAAAWGTAWGTARLARRVVIKLGPNDRDYVSGFPRRWERDGHTRFDWAGLTSAVQAPVRLTGDGWLLRMRLRRHSEEPASVRLETEQRVFAELEIKADRRVAYPIVERPLPPLRGDAPFRLGILCRVPGPQPLCFALDWVEIERAGGSARVLLPRAVMARATLLVASVFLLLRLAGASRRLAAGAAALVLVAMGLGLQHDVVAAERILRLGWPVVLAVLALTAAGLRASWLCRALGVEGSVQAGALAVLVLAALAFRLALLLHPQFFYPDVEIHGLLVWRLDRLGPSQFLREFHEDQFRYSLGLQLVGGNWYAMPYSPALYFMAWPLARWLGYAYETAAALVPAALNALEVLIVFAIGRRLGLSARAAAAAGGFHALLPLFLVRLSLAYFPALTGHFFDALFILLLIVYLERLGQPRIVLALGGLLALTLLTYTQGMLNFGLLIALLLVAELIWDRSAGAWPRRLGLAATGLLGVTLAIGLYYVRYAPAVVQMAHGEPMPGAEIKAELDRQRARHAAAAQPDEDDPDAGPGLNPWRGLRKAGRRLYIFYGGFAPLVVAGLFLVARGLRGLPARFVLVWASLYLALNLASGGLPGPNLVRYNKDLEIVAPLFCLALGRLTEWSWALWRPAGTGLGAAFLIYGVWRAWTALVARFVFEH